MNLRQALYFKTIAEMGGITAAARKLYISQPSLSQMLRLMEEEAGTPLFHRSVPLSLTYAGERYLHAANVLLNTNYILDNELREIRGENRGRLRLGISMQRAAQLLPQVLPNFMKAYPNVELHLQEAGSAALELMVLDGQVDLALASTQAAEPGISYHLLQRETIGILAGINTPLAQRLPSGHAVSLLQALDAPFVSLKQGHNVRVIQDQLFQIGGLHPAIFIETDSMEAARQIAIQCGCYMLCSNSYLSPNACFYPLLHYENNRHFYACVRQKQLGAKYQDAFVSLVLQALEGGT